MGAQHPFMLGEIQDLYATADEDPDINFERRMAKEERRVRNSIENSIKTTYL